MPKWVAYVASVLFLLSYVMWAEVLRENTYLARTIKVEEGQKVISIYSHKGYQVADDANYDGERKAQELIKSMQ